MAHRLHGSVDWRTERGVSCSVTLPAALPTTAPWTVDRGHPALRAFVRRVLARYGIGSADLDDLAQEVFVTMHRRGCAFADEAGARAWSAAAARRLASNHRRGRARARLREAGWLPHVPPSPEEAIADAQLSATIERGLAELSDDARAVVELSALHELSTAEIARTLGMPTDTAYSHLRRGRHRLARVMLAATAIVLLLLSLLAGTCATERADDRVAVRAHAQPADRAADPRRP